MKKLIFIGPFPTPTHGQSIATKALYKQLSEIGEILIKVDVSEDHFKNNIFKLCLRILRHIKAAFIILTKGDLVYISANSNKGMWLSAFLALTSKLKGCHIFIHHHAYDHVRHRRTNMTALAKISGINCVHIVLGETMAKEIICTYPEINQTYVLNNAGLVDLSLLKIPPKLNGPFIVGHLSNLSEEKGVLRVVEIVNAARKIGLDFDLLLAGPCTTPFAKKTIELASSLLKDHFEYRGAIYDNDKISFYKDIDVFIFPSQYKNEAEPLVLLESMAAGVSCISTQRACIPDDIGIDGGKVFREDANFSDKTINHLIQIQQHRLKFSVAARKRFLDLLAKHEKQVKELSNILFHP